jgi:membrane protein implicated in regulation of membrane protease activity
MFSELFKYVGAAVFVFAVAALFWQWAIFAAFGALVVVAGLWLVEAFLRARHKETEEALD